MVSGPSPLQLAGPAVRLLPVPHGGGALPGPVQAKMETAFGADFSDVRVHEGSEAASMGALAYTQGSHIHFAPGQYSPETTAGQELLGHELTHVVQQRAGRVTGLAAKGPALNVDPALEAEADAAGARAARGEAPDVTGADAHGAGAAPSIQPKLGFELEMLVLVDIGGRPAPEKYLIGKYDSLDLVVDRSQTVASLAPTPPEQGNVTIKKERFMAGPFKKNHESGDLHLGTFDLPDTYESLWAYDLGFDPTPNRLRQLDRKMSTVTALVTQELEPRFRELLRLVQHYKTVATQGPLVVVQAACRELVAEAQRLKSDQSLGQQLQVSLGEVEKYVRDVHLKFWEGAEENQFRRKSRQQGTQDWSNDHPITENMGGTGYDSIIEIVTPPHEPETEAGRSEIMHDMQKAVELATAIETATNGLTQRVPIDHINGISNTTTGTHISHPAQSEQTTAASIQSSFAVDLPAIPAFLQRFSTDRNNPVKVTHQTRESKVVEDLGSLPDIADQAIRRLLQDEQEGSERPDLSHLRGLMALVAQYLVIGKNFTKVQVESGRVGGNDRPKRPLDKNAVPLLARSDLAQLYQTTVPEEERNWLTVDRKDRLIQAIVTASGRTGGSRMLTNLREENTGFDGPTFTITCEEFVRNVFTADRDGFTLNLDEGTFKPIGPENVAPGGQKNAPVLELRNIIPQAGDRVPKDQWEPLAAYVIELLAALNPKEQKQVQPPVQDQDQEQESAQEQGGSWLPSGRTLAAIGGGLLAIGALYAWLSRRK